MASDSALNRHVLNTTAPCYVKVEDGIPTTIGGAKLAIDSKLTEQRVFAQQPLWSQLVSTDQHTWIAHRSDPGRFCAAACNSDFEHLGNR